MEQIPRPMIFDRQTDELIPDERYPVFEAAEIRSILSSRERTDTHGCNRPDRGGTRSTNGKGL